MATTNKAAPKQPKPKKINLCERARQLEQDLEGDSFSMEQFILDNILDPIKQLGSSLQESELDVDDRREKVIQWIEKNFNVTINSFR